MTPAGRSRIVLLTGFALGCTWYAIGEHLPERLTVVLMALALLGALALLERARLTLLPAPDRVLLGVSSLLLITALAWRDSDVLTAVNTLALAGLIALRAPGASMDTTVLESGVTDLGARMGRTAAGAVAGSVGALRAFDVRGAGWVPQWSVGLGVVMVSPLIVFFAALLSSADPLMGDLFESVMDINMPPLLERFVPILFQVWVATGLLWALSRRSAPSGADRWAVVRVRPGVLPATAVVSGLTALAGLFAIFLLLQARFLVGGRAFVLGSSGLTFAEYARRGFFELVVVSTTMIPVLLGAEWLADQKAVADRRSVRRLLRVLLVLLAGLVASAMMRMVVYSLEFGLTELRVYTTAFMGWVGVALAWFGSTVLRGRRARFVPGALGSALLVLLALNLLNPAAWIVRYNVARAVAGRPLDARHLADLGGGAVPAALASLDRLVQPDRCALVEALHDRWVVQGPAGRQWTIEGYRAWGRAPDISAARRACREAVGADRDT